MKRTYNINLKYILKKTSYNINWKHNKACYFCNISATINIYDFFIAISNFFQVEGLQDGLIQRKKYL